MDINILDSFEKFWTKAKELGMLKHIVAIPKLLADPRQFWKNYELLSAKEKSVQFITYGGLFALTVWICTYSDVSLVDIFRIIAMEMATMFVYIVTVYAANSIVNRKWEKGLFFIVLCCYMKFVIVIPQLITLRAYYETETPMLMALFALIPLIGELLLLFYSAYVSQGGRRNVLMAIFLSVIFLNIYDSLFIVTGWNTPNNTNFENKIAKERFILGKVIKNAYDIPYCVASRDEGRIVWFLYSNPIDTVASVKFDDPEKYIATVKEDMDSLKAISGKCHFKTNEAFFEQLYALKRDIVYVYETQMYKSAPVIKQTDVMFDTVIVDRIIYQEFNRELQERNENLLDKELKQVEQYDEACSVNYIGALWHPCLYFYSFYTSK